MNAEEFVSQNEKSVRKLAAEVAELRGVLQDLTQQARRIERRIDFVLPEKSRKKTANKISVNRADQDNVRKLGEDVARKTIDDMTEQLRNGKSIESELRNMTVKHGLTPIARELGMTNTALPPKTELIMRIITRLRQTVMLTENIRKMPRVAEDKKYYGDRDKC